MNIQEILRPVLHWWWLLILAMLISTVSSYYFVSQQDPIYRSTTTLTIGRALDDPNPTSNDVYLAQQLAASYADIANRNPIREATKQALGIDWLPGYYARAITNRALIEIAVTDTDPQRAQIIANEIANQLILSSPTSTRGQEQDRQEFVNDQLNLLEEQINETQSQRTELMNQLGNLVSARAIDEAQGQIDTLSAKLTELQSNYANLLASTERGAVNTLTIVEPANLPTRPIGPNILMTVLLAAAVSLSIALGAAYLIDFLDKSIQSSEEATRLMKGSLIGSIPVIKNGANPAIYVSENPRSVIADTYRSLRSNLDFIQIDHPIRTIFVSSPGVGDGKSTTAISLALIMAHADKNVVLVDADLRLPVVHKSLNLHNKTGFTDLFINPNLLNQLVKPWGTPPISVITSGKLPPNSTDLLGSRRMNEILAQLKSRFDYVIIDGPPFIVPDAAVLSAKVDGVLAVIRTGYTQKQDIIAMREQMDLAGAQLLGVVMNKTKVSLNRYYHYYQVETIEESKPTEKPFFTSSAATDLQREN